MARAKIGIVAGLTGDQIENPERLTVIRLAELVVIRGLKVGHSAANGFDDDLNTLLAGKVPHHFVAACQSEGRHLTSRPA